MNRGLVILVLSLLLHSGCAGLRKRPVQSLATPPAGGSRAAFELLNRLSSTDFEAASWSASGQLSVVLNGRRVESAFQLRMQRDSILWMSLKPMLGVEAFRVRLTRDSLQFVNRLNREYGGYPVSELSRMAGTQVEPRLLHELLLGLTGGLRGIAFRYSLDTPGRMEGLSEGVSYVIEADTVQWRPLLLSLSGQQGRVEVNYHSWLWLNDRRAPERLSLRAIPVSDDGQKATEVSLTFSKIEASGVQEFPFSIPSGYRRLP